MKKVIMNKTSLEISEICLGGDGFGSKLNRETTFRILDRFRDGGGNFIDTANIYVRDVTAGYSISERLLGEYLNSRGKRSLVVATKGAHPKIGSMQTPRISREEIGRDLDESLSSLGLDCIDFYWLHRDDRSMPAGEILEILEGFVREGKIRFYGGSNYNTDRLLEADKYAREHGITGFSAVSNMWSPAVTNDNQCLSRDDTLVKFNDNELDIFENCGMAFVPYNSTAKGWFAKRAAGNLNEKLDTIFENQTNLELLEKLKKSAAGGKSIQTALLEYIRAYKAQILPITSVSREDQLDDVLAVD